MAQNNSSYRLQSRCGNEAFEYDHTVMDYCGQLSGFLRLYQRQCISRIERQNETQKVENNKPIMHRSLSLQKRRENFQKQAKIYTQAKIVDRFTTIRYMAFWKTNYHHFELLARCFEHWKRFNSAKNVLFTLFLQHSACCSCTDCMFNLRIFVKYFASVLKE